MTTHLDSLRPVEVLWLRDEHGDRCWWIENALEATLIDLSVRGFIEPDPENEDELQPTGEGDEEELRQYEEDLLEAVQGDDDQQAMLDAIRQFDFESLFYDYGLFGDTTVEHSYLWGLIEWESTERQWLEASESLFTEVDAAREELERAVDDEAVTTEQMPLVYAFPETDFHAEFTDRSEEIVVEVEQASIDAAASNASAAGAAAAVSAATAASCASAAASCSAGAAGAAGGAAAASAAGAGGA